MGKAILIGIAAFIVLGSYYAVGSRGSLFEAERSVATQQFELLARNAAVSGFNRAKQALAGESDLSAFEGSGVSYDGNYQGAVYHTTITAAGSVATVRSVGTATDTYGKEVRFSIRAEVELQAGGGEDAEVPQFMKYAVLSNQSLAIGGSTSGIVHPGEGSEQRNANFHTNGDLSVGGNSASVAGFGTYAGTASSSPSSGILNAFQPNYNPDGLPGHAQSPVVDLPDFDADQAAALLDVDQTTNGNVSLSGTLDFGGTREDPYIWHVKGNLSTSGSVTLSGYVLFVVEGSASIGGGFSSSAGGGVDESTIGLYTGGDISVGGSATVHGQFFSKGNITLGGGSSVYGNIVANGQVQSGGSHAIHYRPASPALTTIWGESELVLISYVEK
jgi:hypothetical protein